MRCENYVEHGKRNKKNEFGLKSKKAPPPVNYKVLTLENFLPLI